MSPGFFLLLSHHPEWDIAVTKDILSLLCQLGRLTYAGPFLPRVGTLDNYKSRLSFHVAGVGMLRVPCSVPI